LTLYEKIGQRLRMLRIEKGLSLADLGNRIGTTAASISRYELGQRKLSFELCEKISEALEIPLSQFVPFEEMAGLVFDFNSIVSGLDEAKTRIDELYTLSNDEQKTRLSSLLEGYSLLNDEGQRVAADRVQELTEIPKYQADK